MSLTTRKISRVQTVTTMVEYPDYYTYDESPRGAAADALLTARGYRASTVRENIYDDEKVEGAISLLKDIYRDVDLVLAVTKS